MTYPGSLDIDVRAGDGERSGLDGRYLAGGTPLRFAWHYPALRRAFGVTSEPSGSAIETSTKPFVPLPPEARIPFLA